MEDKTVKPDARLTGQDRLLLAVNGLFAVAGALSGTFVNVYLWKVKNDFAMIGWFALFAQLAGAVTFWIAGKWVKEFNKMHSLRVGIAISALFYALVLLLGKQATQYVIVLGIVQGVASGFFWLAFNVVYFEVTNPGNRDKFNGWAGLIGSGAGMFAPWLSGYIISRMADTNGYRLIFTMSLIVFVVGVIVSFFLKKRKVQSTYEWLYGFRQLAIKGNEWRLLVPALAAQGVREGVFGFLIGLFVYIATKNELKVGTFSLITSAVALISFYFVGKILKPRIRNRSMLIGTAAMTCVIIPFFWEINFTTLLLFGIGTSLFIPLYTIPMTSIVFDNIGKDEKTARYKVEYVVLRELGLNAGRMMGTILFILVVSLTRNQMIMNALLLFIGSFPVLAWLFMRKLPLQRP